VAANGFAEPALELNQLRRYSDIQIYDGSTSCAGSTSPFASGTQSPAYSACLNHPNDKRRTLAEPTVTLFQDQILTSKRKKTKMQSATLIGQMENDRKNDKQANAGPEL